MPSMVSLFGCCSLRAVAPLGWGWLRTLSLLLALLVMLGAVQARTTCPAAAPWGGPEVEAWVQAEAPASMRASPELLQGMAAEAEPAMLSLDTGSDDPKDPPGDLFATPVLEVPSVAACRPADWRHRRLAVPALRLPLRPPDA